VIWAAIPSSTPAEEPGDRIAVQRHPSYLELGWADTEDRLRGTLTPGRPRAGDVVHVVLDVGAYDGKAFDGPITVQLRQAGETHGESVTVRHERGWQADFPTTQNGTHWLDVSFRTTRLKALHATFDVGEAQLPGGAWWIIFGCLVAVAVAYATLRLVRGNRAPRGNPPSPT
jgi:hypothetical protein